MTIVVVTSSRTQPVVVGQQPVSIISDGFGQRQPRETDSGFLAYLRRQPCDARHMGGCNGPIQAAHIRYSDAARGSVNPGMGRKNHDRHATALCETHHIHGQHRTNERAWWASIGRDAYETAAAHFARCQRREGEA